MALQFGKNFARTIPGAVIHTKHFQFQRNRQYPFNEVAQGLIRLPIWIPQTSFLLGVLIFFVAVLDELLLVLRKEKPSYQVAEEARIASGDFSETV